MNPQKHPPHLSQPIPECPHLKGQRLQVFFFLWMSKRFGAVPEQSLCILWAVDQTHVEAGVYVSAGAHTHASEILIRYLC